MFNQKKKFIIQYFTLTVFLSILVIAFNVLINPYGIFSTTFISIEDKPAALTHMRMYKAHEVNRVKPKTIILGTSRAAIGLDPSNHYFKHQPVYNLALDGANLYEILCYLQHANRDKQLKEVVLLLDLMSFNIHMQNKPDFDEHRLSHARPILFEKQISQSLFSLESTIDSYKTLRRKFDKSLPTLNANGMTKDAALTYYKISNGGHHNTSRHSESTYIREVYRPFAMHGSANHFTHFEHFASILRFCHFHHIQLHLIISPMHVRHHILLDAIGQWQEYEKWKRTLVTYNQRIAQELNTSPYPLWDFSEVNAFTTEPIPEMGDVEYVMKWFWETSHFNKQFGDLILKRALITETPNRITQEQAFGYLLTADNIDFSLHKLSLQKEAYKMNHPETVQEIASLKAEIYQS